MAETQRRKAEELFQQVADLPQARRSVYLDEHCPAGSALRGQVERLLSRLEQGRIRSLTEVECFDELDADLVGREIGPYKLVRLVGEGGFGAVYQAEQERPLRRTVALKIIKLGMDTRQVIARFEAERQALAMMEHPNIARVLDADITDRGRPYFVMELVDGTPITRYCDENRLSIRERLELFVQTCRAVQHAHQKGIIHRDIKPSNVLVGRSDGAPVPKVIDFGIAKATSGPLATKTLSTDILHFVGTPEYMSPEQAQSGLGGRADLDTRTDIYSLGVLLYELLTGTTPFHSKSPCGAALGDVQRLIRDQEPPPPSQRVGTLGAQLMEAAKARTTDPGTLVRLLRGDLDWITVKALDKDRTRRYDTSAALAEDVERHLSGQPVLAGPPSRTYRFRKFVRRNRPIVFGGAVFAAAVIGCLCLATIGFLRASREAESAKTINVFFNDMLTSVDPMQLQAISAYTPETSMTTAETGGFARDISVAEMLSHASTQIDEAFAGKPQLAARAHETVGMTLRGLGRYAEAEPQLRAALDIRRRLLGDEHPDVLRSLLSLGELLFDVGRPAEGEPLVRAACDGMEEVFGREHPRTLSCAAILAAVLSDSGRFEESESVFERTLTTQRRVLGAQHRDTLMTMWRRSVSYLLYWKLIDGQALAAELYEITHRTLPANDSLFVLSQTLMGWWHIARYDFASAESVLRPGLAQCRRILGDEHPFTYKTMQGLAHSLQGKDAQAEKEGLFRRALAGLRATRGNLHWQTISSAARLAEWLDEQGAFVEAEELYRRLVADCRQGLGDDAQLTRDYMCEFADFLERVGKLEEAIAVRRERLGITRRNHGPESLLLQLELDALAGALLRTGRIDEARAVTRELVSAVHTAAETSENDARTLNAAAWALLRCNPSDMRDVSAALNLAEKAVALTRGEWAAALDTLALAYHEIGDYDRAWQTQLQAVEQLGPESLDRPTYDASLNRYLLERGDVDGARRHLQESFAQNRVVLSRGNPFLALCLVTWGETLASRGHLAMAEVYITDGLQLTREQLGGGHDRVAYGLVKLADVYAGQNAYAQAAEALEEALALYRNLLGNEHLQVAETLHALGRTLLAGSNPRGAVGALHEALTLYRALSAEDIPAGLSVQLNLADALVSLHQLDEAEPLAWHALTKIRALYGDTHPQTVMAGRIWGVLLLRRGDAPKAEAELRRWLEACVGLDLDEHDASACAEVEGALGECLTVLRRFEEAESRLLRSFQVLQAVRGDAYAGTRAAANRLVVVYEAQNQPERAARWQAHPTAPPSMRGPQQGPRPRGD